MPRIPSPIATLPRLLVVLGFTLSAATGMMMRAAQADPITFAFTGHVVSVDDRVGALDGSISDAGGGTSFTGTYTFDSSTLDTNDDPTVGDYQHSTTGYGIVVNMGSYTFQTDPGNVNFLLEVVNRPLDDHYLLRSYNNLPTTGGMSIEHIAWQLDDFSGTALASDSLPLAPPNLPQWQQVFALTVEGCPTPSPFEFCFDSFFIRAIIETVRCYNDIQAPTLSVSLTPTSLFPPNHSLKTIHASVMAQDLCDEAPQFRLVSITSDEPDQGTDSEDVPNDIQGADLGTPDLEFQVRAERDGNGNGRTYTVCYEAVDASGNVARQAATVVVPHDRSARAHLSAGQAGWTLTIYGTQTMSARAVVTGSVMVATPSVQVGATAAPSIYADVDNDEIEDATFTLSPGLTAAGVASGGITARWTAAGDGYQADISSGVTGVGDAGRPLAFEAGASPNPSRSEATIHYALPREGDVRIRVFDVTGRQVASLVDGRVPAGRHVVSFRPRVPQLYLYRVEWEGKSLTGRLTVLR